MSKRSELYIDDLPADALERNSALRGISVRRTRDDQASELRVTDRDDAASVTLFYEGEPVGLPRQSLGYSYPQLVELGFAIAEFGLRSWQDWNERYAVEHEVADSPKPAEEIEEQEQSQ